MLIKCVTQRKKKALSQIREGVTNQAHDKLRLYSRFFEVAKMQSDIFIGALFYLFKDAFKDFITESAAKVISED